VSSKNPLKTNGRVL